MNVRGGRGRQAANLLVPPVQIVDWLREREPPVFYGSAGEDVVNWVSRFERISEHNQWNPARRLIQMSICLEGVAQEWFESLIPPPVTYPALRAAVLAAFRNPNYEFDVERQIRNRFQGVEEPVMTYCYNVIYLCSKLDPNMPEQAKVNHILRGLKPALLDRVYPHINPGVTDTTALFTLLQSHSQASHLANQSEWSSRVLPPPPVMQLNLPKTPFVTKEELDSVIKDVKKEVEESISEVKSTIENKLEKNHAELVKLLGSSPQSS